ncbi:hypothetical protein Tco_0690650 [Tanacetum coccineum]
MSHWRDFMDKRSSVRVSAPAYSSRCPTGAREFSELFIMGWTMIRNSERKSDVMVMDSMENVVKRSIGGSETTVGMKYEPPSQGQEKIKEISSLVADKNDEDNENDPYDGLYRWKCSVSHIVEDLSRGGVLLILDGWLVEEYRVLRDSARFAVKCGLLLLLQILLRALTDIVRRFVNYIKDSYLLRMAVCLGGKQITLYSLQVKE